MPIKPKVPEFVDKTGVPPDDYLHTNLLFELDGFVITPLCKVLGLENIINETSKNIHHEGNPYSINNATAQLQNNPNNRTKDSNIGYWNPNHPYGRGFLGFLEASVEFALRIGRSYSKGDIAKVIMEQGALYAMNPVSQQIINPLFPFLGPLAQPNILGNTLDGLAGKDYESATGLDNPTTDERGKGNLIDQLPGENESYLVERKFTRRQNLEEKLENSVSNLLGRFKNTFNRPNYINTEDETFSDELSNNTLPKGIGRYGQYSQRFTQQTFLAISNKKNSGAPTNINFVNGDELHIKSNDMYALDRFYDDPSWETSNYNRFLPFTIKDLRKLDKQNEIYLRAFITTLSETYSPDWEKVEIYGRPENFAHWKNCDRKFQVTLDFPAFNPHELASLYKKLNFLAQLNYAEFKNGKPYQPPICRLRLGDLIKRTVNGSAEKGDSVSVGLAGYFDGLNIDYTGKSNTWETESGSKVPKIFTVSFGFNVLHDVSVDSNTNFYDVDGIGSNFSDIYQPVTSGG